MSESNGRPTAYLTTSAFAAAFVRGLDYPLAMANCRCRPPPSSLYTFPAGWAWLGIGMALRALAFPEFEGFCTRRFRRGTRSLQGGCSTN